MIQRRGFLAGCMAALAAPLAWFKNPTSFTPIKVWRHANPNWRTYTFTYTHLNKADFDAALKRAMDRMVWSPPIAERSVTHEEGIEGR